ncbi:MAG: DUF4198 domain-containing protein [Planctomycetota bacterium]
MAKISRRISVHNYRANLAPRSFLLLITAVAALAAGAAAHEYWIEPRKTVERGKSFELAAYSGERFVNGERKLLTPEKLRGLRFVDSLGPQDLLSALAQDVDVRTVKTRVAGTAIVALHSKHSYLELEPAKFNEYLKEEGLNTIRELRIKDGKDNEPGRELYQRCTKMFVQVSDRAQESETDTKKKNQSSVARAPVGLPFEIIPATDPTQAKTGQNLSVLVLFRGEPAGNILLRLFHRSTDASVPNAKAKESRTTAEGSATFTIDQAGEYLISGVHMIRAAAGVDPRHAEAEWESFFSSITFTTGEEAPPPAKITDKNEKTESRPKDQKNN